MTQSPKPSQPPLRNGVESERYLLQPKADPLDPGAPTMALVEPEQFSEKDVARVYIAASRSEARRVEDTLGQGGVDYAVDAAPFKTYVLGILPSHRTGVGFYVLADQARFARDALRRAGLELGVVEEEPCRWESNDAP